MIEKNLRESVSLNRSIHWHRAREYDDRFKQTPEKETTQPIKIAFEEQWTQCMGGEI